MIHVGVDIDDTLCYFTPPLNDYFNKKYGTHYSIEDYTTTSFDKVRSISAEGAHDFIREFVYTDRTTNLLPIDGALEVLVALKETGWYTFHAISARDIALYDETYNWIEQHYPGVFSSIQLCNYYGSPADGRRAKSEVCKSLGVKVMIDNRPDVLGIRVLTYGQSWNETEDSHTWKYILALLRHGPIADILSKHKKGHDRYVR